MSCERENKGSSSPHKVQKAPDLGIKACAAGSPAEVILLGSNYDDSITYPAFFRKYILPPLRDYAEVVHRKGKYLMTHADGEIVCSCPWTKRPVSTLPIRSVPIP